MHCANSERLLSAELYTPDVERHQEGGVLTVKHQPDVRGVSGVLSGGLGSPPWVLFSDVHPGIEALVLLSPWFPPLPFADRWGIKSPCPSALKLDSSSPPRKLLGHQRLLLGLPTRQEPGGPEIHLLPLCPSPAFFLGRQVGDGSLCSLCLSLSFTHTHIQILFKKFNKIISFYDP